MKAQCEIEKQYFAYNAAFFFSRALYMATCTLFVTDLLGIPLAAVALVGVADYAFGFLSEIPTGTYADLRGRKASFLRACECMFTGFALFAIFGLVHVPGALAVAAAIVGFGLLGIGMGFYSGALDAWAIDLKGLEDERSLQGLFRRSQTLKNLALIVGGPIGIFLHFANAKGIFLVSTFTAAAVVMALILVHARKRMINDTPKQVSDSKLVSFSFLRESFVQFRDSYANLKKDRRAMQIVFAMATSYLIVQLLVTYWPYYLIHEAARPGHPVGNWIDQAMKLSGAYIFIYASRMVGTWIGSRPRFSKNPDLGVRTAILLNSIPLFALLILPAIIQLTRDGSNLYILCILACGLVRMGEAMGEPFRQAFLNERLRKEQRATILSIASAYATFMSIVGLTIASVFISLGMTPSQIWAMAAILCLSSLGAFRSARAQAPVVELKTGDRTA